MSEPKYTILVVDDERMEQELHGAYVEAFGYEVEKASDGIEAIAKLSLGIDLVLTDAHMPNIDGFEVATRIRERWASDEIPIVMVTSLAASEDRVRAYEVGINDFINKPVDPNELKLRLKWLLELKSARDELRAHQARLESMVDERTSALKGALREITKAQRDTEEAHLDTIKRLTLAAEYKDQETHHHIERIGLYSQAVGWAMHLQPRRVDLLRYAAPMHDVGKLAIPDSILLKPGPLDPDERQIMNTHTTKGAQILANSRSDIIKMGQEIALSHHEKWDGTGYPERRSGEEIPLEARICSVVDFFDALTSDRPYRKAVPSNEVIRMILEQDGTAFDPDIVAIFMDVREEIEHIRAEYLAPA